MDFCLPFKSRSRQFKINIKRITVFLIFWWYGWKKKRSINWFKEVTDIYTSVIAEADVNYLETLAQKALKNNSSTETSENMMSEFNQTFTSEGFIVKNNGNILVNKAGNETKCKALFFRFFFLRFFFFFTMKWKSL